MPDAATSAVASQVMAMLVSYVQSPEEAVAAHGVRLLLAAVDTLASAQDAAGWAAIVEPVLALAAEDPLQQLAPVQTGGERQRGHNAKAGQSASCTWHKSNPAAVLAVRMLASAAAASAAARHHHSNTGSRQLGFVHATGDLPNGTAGITTASAAAACGRCRVVVMLQRLVARLHAAHAERMPPAAALQLVSVLQVRPLQGLA